MTLSTQLRLTITGGAAAMLIFTASSPLRAQDTSSEKTSNWMTAFSLGIPGFRDQAYPELFTLGANFTQLNLDGIGADFSVGILPRGLFEGGLALGARAGIAVPVAVSRTLLLIPSGGASLLGVVSANGGGGLTGWNGGLAAVLSAPRAPAGLRLGATWHEFKGIDGVWLLEIGIALIPARP